METQELPPDAVPSARRPVPSGGTARALLLIAAAEAACDTEGIDALLDRYGKADLRACADAFAGIGAAAIARSLHKVVARLPDRPEKLLDDADELIKAREGYDEELIQEFVRRQSLPPAEIPPTDPAGNGYAGPVPPADGPPNPPHDEARP